MGGCLCKCALHLVLLCGNCFGVSRGSDYLRESSTPVGCEEGGSNAVRFILLNSKMPVGFPTGVFYFTLNLR